MTIPTSAAPESPDRGRLVPVRVWDLPTRVFHWALVVAVAGAIVTGEIGDPWMAWHERCGETAGGLLVFRLAWGLVGGTWSRFSRFLPSPGRLARHLRGTPATEDHPGAGHNPLGALSVWAMLGLLAAQVATGLVADDEVATTGPFNHLVGSVAAKRATNWHTGWGLDLVFVLLALHVVAIAWYVLRKREPILRAMVTGDRTLPPGTPASGDGTRQRALGLVLAALALGAVFGAVRHFGA
jgi:cytochrome b